MSEIACRTATSRDAPAIAALLPDLGYPATVGDIERRLARLAAWPDNAVLVAERAGALVGLCHVQGVPLLASDGYAEVQALVVAAHARRRGIGGTLVRAALAWARERGYTRVRLRSGLHRTDAHRFYESEGFVRTRASYAFERSPETQP